MLSAGRDQHDPPIRHCWWQSAVELGRPSIIQSPFRARVGLRAPCAIAPYRDARQWRLTRASRGGQSGEVPSDPCWAAVTSHSWNASGRPTWLRTARRMLRTSRSVRWQRWRRQCPGSRIANSSCCGHPGGLGYTRRRRHLVPFRCSRTAAARSALCQETPGQTAGVFPPSLRSDAINTVLDELSDVAIHRFPVERCTQCCRRFLSDTVVGWAGVGDDAEAQA